MWSPARKTLLIYPKRLFCHRPAEPGHARLGGKHFSLGRFLIFLLSSLQYFLTGSLASRLNPTLLYISRSIAESNVHGDECCWSGESLQKVSKVGGKKNKGHQPIIMIFFFSFKLIFTVFPACLNEVFDPGVWGRYLMPC